MMLHTCLYVYIYDLLAYLQALHIYITQVLHLLIYCIYMHQAWRCTALVGMRPAAWGKIFAEHVQLILLRG